MCKPFVTHFKEMIAKSKATLQMAQKIIFFYVNIDKIFSTHVIMHSDSNLKGKCGLNFREVFCSLPGRFYESAC